jgi:putative ABC transport system substrate-binding protein
MQRRTFIQLVGVLAAGSALASPLRAQHLRRIGVLVGTGNDEQGRSWVAAFEQGLNELGWVADRNIQIDLTWGGADIERIRSTAAVMVGSKPDLMFVYSVRVLNIVRRASPDLPIVFIATNDPVGLGIVQSLSHPGGNLTGFMLYEVSVVGKLVELLKEMLPALSKVALLYNPDNSSAAPYWRFIEAVAHANAISPVRFSVHDAASIEHAVATFAREPNGGVVLPPDVTTTEYRDLLVNLAARYRVPMVYSFQSAVAKGGLISYGPDTSDLFRRAASYVDRILKGERPSDLPVQAPTKYTLAVNLKTARAFGLNLPTSILLRAHEVID